jgi:hypothetical protein
LVHFGGVEVNVDRHTSDNFVHLKDHGRLDCFWLDAREVIRINCMYLIEGDSKIGRKGTKHSFVDFTTFCFNADRGSDE